VSNSASYVQTEATPKSMLCSPTLKRKYPLPQ